MPLTLKSTGGGSVTLASAVTAADTTLTVPAQNGNIVVSDASSNVTVDGNLTVVGATTLSGNPTVSGTVVMGSSFMRNRIINGAMVIDQRNAGASATASSGYIYGTDRNRSYVGTATARWSCQQSTDAPSGFTYSFLLTTTTAQTSFAAGDLGVSFEQAIEGYNIADLAWGTASAKTVTVSFWIKASIAGAYAVAVFNSNAGTIDRSYPTSVTVNAVNTWEYKTVTIPGDTTGVWQTANNIGIFLAIGAFGGSNFVGTANTWQSGLKEYPSGCVNIASTVGATLRLTGVQFEVGSVATPFERRQYTTELTLCQRYFEKSFPIGVAPAHNTGYVMFNSTGGSAGCSSNTYWAIYFKVTKKGNASIRLYDPTGAGSASSNLFRVFFACDGGQQGSAYGIGAATDAYFSGYTQYAGQTDVTTGFHWTAEAEL